MAGEPAGSYLSEPRGPEGRKVKARALKYRVTSDGVLVARADNDAALGEDLPVVPDVRHASDVEGAPRGLSWKHVMLGAVHNTVTGSHRRPQEMHDELVKLVAWWPPDHLLRDCKEWRGRCKVCTSVHNRPREEAPYHAVRASVPFFRMQADLMEVKPTGAEGERGVMTAICVATRYIFLRRCRTREAPEFAFILLDIILDAGVLPAAIQSDNEFANLAFEEICT